jgi:hypothetical protein
MLVLLTSQILMHVKSEEEGAEVAMIMDGVMKDSLSASHANPQDIVHLGVLTQIVPDEILR